MLSYLYFFLSLSVFLLGLLLLSQESLYFDDFADMNRSELSGSGIVLNGDPALLSTVVYGHSILPQQSMESTICSGTNASSNGVMAVIIMDAMSLSYGTITSIYTERLLHGLRMALITGAPWLIIPSYGFERRKLEDILWQLNPPGETVFPEDVVEKLPPNTRYLARKMRESMTSESYLRDWIQRGHLIDRLFLSSSVNQSWEETPRVIRYGKNEWIVPGILWADSLNTQMTELTMAEQASQIMMRNIVEVRGKAQQTSAEETPWLQMDCFDLVVVSNVHNGLYAKVMLSKELQRSWKFQNTHVLSNSPEGLVECVRVLTATTEDTGFVWLPPTPWFVRFTSKETFNPDASYFAQFLGFYAHTLYVNYNRWFTAVKAYLLEYRVFGFLNAGMTLFGALLTEIISIQDIIVFGFGIC